MDQRKIIHIDMDCFYAAIEVRDNPRFKGKPVAVGGAANSRGVLCTCNYEARKFGLHSAMASAQAVRKCPELIILPVNFEKYRSSSKNIHEIFKQYTNLVEPLSLDEAFLDVSESHYFSGSATLLAQEIRERIYQTEGITASAGIAPNKMLAKIASDWNKPNGQYVITPDNIQNFMLTLPVKKLFGVGKVTAEKLSQYKIYNCGDVQKWPLQELIETFGSYGKQLYNMSRGVDNREVQTSHERKSLSVEETFSSDYLPKNIPTIIIKTLFTRILDRLDKINLDKNKDIKSLFVKIKFNDFKTTTIQAPYQEFSIDAFRSLLNARSQEINKPIRLLGFGLHFKTRESKNFGHQLSFNFNENRMVDADE